MNRQISKSILYDMAGEMISESILTGLMVVDTTEEDDIEWDDYENVQTLVIYDPIGEVTLDDIEDLKKIKNLYLQNCSDISDFDDLDGLKSSLYLLRIWN